MPCGTFWGDLPKVPVKWWREARLGGHLYFNYWPKCNSWCESTVLSKVIGHIKSFIPSAKKNVKQQSLSYKEIGIQRFCITDLENPITCLGALTVHYWCATNFCLLVCTHQCTASFNQWAVCTWNSTWTLRMSQTQYFRLKGTSQKEPIHRETPVSPS